MESTVKPALRLMAGRGVAMMATFIAPLVLVRLFDQAQFGTYKQLFLVYGTLYNIAQVGMAESLFYFLPRAVRPAGGYVANAMLTLGAAGLAGLLLLWAGAPAMARWLGNPALAGHLPRLGLFLMLMLPSAALEIVMIGCRRYSWGAISYGVSDVLRALALIVPALAWRSLDGLLAGAAVFAAVRLVAAAVYFRREFDGELRPRAGLEWAQLAYALPFALTVLVDTVQLSYHQYAVAHRFDAATFAVYSVGCFQVPLMELVASPLANVMMVRMAERLRDGRGDAALAVWTRTTRTLALIFFPVLAILLVSARDLIALLFTESYLASVPIFMVWSLALGASVLQTDAVLRVYAATRFMLVAGIVKLTMIAALIALFISAFGLPGAVIVSLVAMLTLKAAALVRMRSFFGVGLGRVAPWRDLARIATAATAAALPALAVRAVVPGPLLVRLALTGLAGGGAYLTILFQAGLLDRSEREAVSAWWQRFIPRVAAAGESGS